MAFSTSGGIFPPSPTPDLLGRVSRPKIEAMNTHLSLRNDFAAQRYASLSRRRFLRGLGACLALPAFESFRQRERRFGRTSEQLREGEPVPQTG